MEQGLLLQELKKAGLSLELATAKILKFKIQIVSITVQLDSNMRKLRLFKINK